MSDNVATTIQAIRELYRADSRPWIVGFSGGKDSTAVLQLVFHAVMGLKPAERHKPIHVVSSDTLVEPPVIGAYLDNVHRRVRDGASREGLPVFIAKVNPLLDDTFFVNLIGRGYPAPNRWFRWCTERLKINPTSRYIEQTIRDSGSVIILLGARKAESTTRAQALTAYEIEGSALRRHATLPQAYVYAPIVDWTNDEVWAYLCSSPPPWGGSNWELLRLYKDAAGGECPLVIDRSTPSCGNSRFGCWVCTVVENDASMQGFIDTGRDNLVPLLEFRNWLKTLRDDETARAKTRRNGQAGLGPFTLETRQEILRRLLLCSKATGLKLIRSDELELIQFIWTQEGMGGTVALDIYNGVFHEGGTVVDLSHDEIQRREERDLLFQTCEKHSVDSGVVERLIAIERSLYSKLRRRGLTDQLDEVISSTMNEALSKPGKEG